jgi:hypothetical protein
VKTKIEESIIVQLCEYVPRKENEKYGYGTFNLSWISNKKPTTTEIDKGSVIYCFQKLTGKNKLPKPVLRFLNDYYSKKNTSSFNI